MRSHHISFFSIQSSHLILYISLQTQSGFRHWSVVARVDYSEWIWVLIHHFHHVINELNSSPVSLSDASTSNSLLEYWIDSLFFCGKKHFASSIIWSGRAKSDMIRFHLCTFRLTSRKNKFALHLSRRRKKEYSKIIINRACLSPSDMSAFRLLCHKVLCCDGMINVSYARAMIFFPFVFFARSLSRSRSFISFSHSKSGGRIKLKWAPNAMCPISAINAIYYISCARESQFHSAEKCQTEARATAVGGWRGSDGGGVANEWI